MMVCIINDDGHRAGVANMMVWLHVVASFQVFTQPIFEALESSCTRRWPSLERRLLWIRLVWRSLYVVAITLIAAALPFFTDLMGLIGAAGFIPMTFVMPCILSLVAHRGQLGKVRLVANWAIIVLFTVVAFAAFIASAANIAIKKRHGQLKVWSDPSAVAQADAPSIV
jgi:amino acid permease